MSLTQGFLWLITIVLSGVLIWRRFPEVFKKRVIAGTGKAPETAGELSSPFWGTLFDALTHPFTWILWVLTFSGVWLYSHNLLTAPNLTWVPLLFWMLFVLFSVAEGISKENSNGKRAGKPHPRLVTLRTVTQRIAFLATIFVIVYYGFLAPQGTWRKLTAKTTVGTAQGPNGKMIIPEGIPLNPNFTSTKLANWKVTYVAANPQYRVPQARWHGQRIVLKEEPGREVAEVVNLTLGFDKEQEALDIHLAGSCKAVTDTRRPQISKTCAGWWKDRGGKISGQFYLQVNEGSNRYFDVYLYDGNFLPKKSDLAMMLSGPPIPAIMLQFRPLNWNEDKN